MQHYIFLNLDQHGDFDGFNLLEGSNLVCCNHWSYYIKIPHDKMRR